MAFSWQVGATIETPLLTCIHGKEMVGVTFQFGGTKSKALCTPGLFAQPQAVPGLIWFTVRYCAVLVAQLCPTLCKPMVCSPPGSSCQCDSPGKNTGVSCHALFRGIFSTQGSNPGLPHCRWILSRLSHQRQVWRERHGDRGPVGKKHLWE